MAPSILNLTASTALVILASIFYAKADSGALPHTTCSQFKKRLAETIASGGDKVVVPDLSEQDGGGNDPGIVRYEFHNIVGLDGVLVCGQNGLFQNVGIKSRFQAIDAEGIRRFYRLQTLSAAALCSEVNQGQKTCTDEVASLFASARRDMAYHDLRGEKDPVGDVTKEYPGIIPFRQPTVEIEVVFRRGGIWVGVSESQ
jgi:hypothetical protein